MREARKAAELLLLLIELEDELVLLHEIGLVDVKKLLQELQTVESAQRIDLDQLAQQCLQLPQATP